MRAGSSAETLRSPGQSLNLKVDDAFRVWTTHVISTAGIMVSYALYEWARWIFNWESHPVALSLLALAGCVFVCTSLDPIRSRWRLLRVIRGDKRRAAEHLGELAEHGYTILHDFAPTEFRMDHVLIGSSGLFAVATESLEAKPRRGEEIRYDGTNLFHRGKPLSRDPIARARVMADWLNQKVHQTLGRRFPVQPVVLFPDRHIEGPLTTSDIWVLNSKAMPSYMNLEQKKLSRDDQEKLVRILKDFSSKQG